MLWILKRYILVIRSKDYRNMPLNHVSMSWRTCTYKVLGTSLSWYIRSFHSSSCTGLWKGTFARTDYENYAERWFCITQKPGFSQAHRHQSHFTRRFSLDLDGSLVLHINRMQNLSGWPIRTSKQIPRHGKMWYGVIILRLADITFCVYPKTPSRFWHA